jgi:hypothetical protein
MKNFKNQGRRATRGGESRGRSNIPENFRNRAEYEPSAKNKMPGSIRTMEVGARPDGRLLNGPLWDKA